MTRMLKSLIAGAMVLPAVSLADGLNYNYVEASYISGEIENVVGTLDVDGDGFALNGSLAIAPNWHLFAEASRIDFDFGVDGTTYGVGVGYNHSISPMADLIGRLSWVKAEFDAPGGASADDDGFSLAALLRGMVGQNVELEGGVEYVDFGGTDGDDTALVAAGRYAFTNAFSAGLSLGVSDDVTEWGANFRFYFR